MCCLYLRSSHFFLMLRLVNICIIRNQKEVNELCAKNTFILNGSNHILAAPECPGIVLFHKVGSSPSAYSHISEITTLFFCVADICFVETEVKSKSTKKQSLRSEHLWPGLVTAGPPHAQSSNFSLKGQL